MTDESSADAPANDAKGAANATPQGGADVRALVQQFLAEEKAKAETTAIAAKRTAMLAAGHDATIVNALATVEALAAYEAREESHERNMQARGLRREAAQGAKEEPHIAAMRENEKERQAWKAELATMSVISRRN